MLNLSGVSAKIFNGTICANTIHIQMFFTILKHHLSNDLDDVTMENQIDNFNQKCNCIKSDL